MTLADLRVSGAQLLLRAFVSGRESCTGKQMTSATTEQRSESAGGAGACSDVIGANAHQGEANVGIAC